jgi:hypothetical protein
MAPNERTVAAFKQIEEMILPDLRYFRWNRKSDWLSFQPLAPVSIPSKIARNHFAASNPRGVKGLSRN